MKSFIASLLLLSTLGSLAEEIDNLRLVSIRAELEVSRDNAKRERTESIGYNLEIELRGAKSVTNQVEVVTIIFAKRLPGGRLTEKRSSDKIRLDKQWQANVTSSTENLTYTREYDKRIQRQRRSGVNRNQQRNPPRFRTIPASGERYSGWAIRVYDKAGRLLGEEASASHFKLDP